MPPIQAPFGNLRAPAARARFLAAVLARGMAGIGLAFLAGCHSDVRPIAPILTSHPASLAVPAGSRATFTAAAFGRPTWTWERSLDGAVWTVIPGAQAATYTFTCQASDSGARFRAVAAHGSSRTSSQAAILTVQTLPTFTTHPANQSATTGIPVTFTAEAAGTPDPTYQWQRAATGGDWTDIPSATSASYTFTPALADAGSAFRAVATNLLGSATSDAATLAVQDPAPSGLAYPAPVAVYTQGLPIPPQAPTWGGGTPTGFTVDPPLPAGLALDPATGVVSGTPTQAGSPVTCTVRALNGGGSATATLTLTIVAPPLAPVITAPSLVTEGRSGYAATVPAQAGCTYAWTLTNGAITSGRTSATLAFTAGSPGSVRLTCVVTNAAGTAAAGECTLSAVGAPRIGRFDANPTTLTSTDTAFLTGDFENGTGVLLPGNRPMASGTPMAVSGLLASTTYKLVVTNAAGDTATATARISLPPGFTHLPAIVNFHEGGAAALLPDGKVLNATGGFMLYTRADILDPITGTSVETPQRMAVPRGFPAAVTMPDGKVMIIGGYSTHGDPRIAECYDPATGTFSTTGMMATERRHQTATLLPDGRILVVGGLLAEGNRIQEIYDPATGLFTPTALSPWEVRSHAALLLPDGRVLIAGGAPTETSARCMIYDPAANTFYPTGSMAVPRFGLDLVLLPDGKVLAAGGGPDAEVYDPATGTWSLKVSTPGILYDQVTVAPLMDGRILWLTSGADRRVQILDPATGILTEGGRLGRFAGPPILTPLPDGRLLLTSDDSQVEVYDPQIPAPLVFSDAGDMVSARRFHTATRLGDGTVLVTGGLGSAGSLSTSERFDPATSTFGAGPSLAQARHGHGAIRLPDGGVLIAGGADGSSPALASAERFDPVLSAFRPTGSMIQARAGAALTLLPGGKVLVAGGQGAAGALSTAERYDPASGTFLPAGSMSRPRTGHTATLLRNGLVLVAGGDAGSGPLAGAELYDPATDTFRPAGTLSTARTNHVAILLPDGKVLLAGGEGANGLLASAECYDPATGAFVPTDSMAAGRTLAAISPMPGGRFLIAGGVGASGELATAEVYNAREGIFEAAAPMSAPRRTPGLTLLGDGRILVTGGNGQPGSERFQ